MKTVSKRDAAVRKAHVAPTASQWEWTTAAATVIALALVAARACMSETLREPFAAVSTGAPRAPGVATSLVLDWLCCAPMLLILARRAFDSSYRVRLTWPHLFFGLLAAWAMLSTIWADDKFAAVAGAFHFLCAFAIFFAASQLFRTWRRLRLLAAISFGLLLIYTASGVYYRYLDLPDLQRYWRENPREVLRQRGIEEGSYAARQFAQKIENGEMIGFNVSPNSFAAVLSLLVIASAGLMIQRQASRDGPASIAAFAIPIAMAIWVMSYTRSKAAFATLFLSAILLALNRMLRRQLVTHRRFAFAACLFAVVVAIAIVIGIGLSTGGLFNDSLTFRWNYWIASARIVLDRPLLGVGWNNFGPHYLAYRLPQAAEEIKDPHNFGVRFFAELGAVGGVLVLAWMVSMWWTLTRPVLPGDDPDNPPKTRSPIRLVVLIACGAMAINLLASVDLFAAPAFVFLEIIKRSMYLILLIAGLAVASIRSMERQEVDGRSSPWIVHAILVALLMFLLHNVVDFSMFEVGPMFVFALLTGGVIAIRSNFDRPEKSWARSVFVTVAVLWLGSLGLVIPIASAEQSSYEATQAEFRGAPTQAAAKFTEALNAIPYNAEYAFRAARAMIGASSSPGETRAMLERAIAGNPSEVPYRLLRAKFEWSRGTDRFSQVRSDYETAISLNPNDVEIRLEFADMLKRVGLDVEARNQYQAALAVNDRLNPKEPKRLSQSRVDAIQKTIDELK